MEWFASKWRFLAAILIAAVLGYLGFLDWQKQSVARSAGVEACTQRGQPLDRCKTAVAQNDTACLGLTGSDDRRTSAGEIVDPERYVECVLEGPGPYRRRMRQKHAEARARTAGSTTTSPR